MWAEPDCAYGPTIAAATDYNSTAAHACDPNERAAAKFPSTNSAAATELPVVVPVSSAPDGSATYSYKCSQPGPYCTLCHTLERGTVGDLTSYRIGRTNATAGITDATAGRAAIQRLYDPSASRFEPWQLGHLGSVEADNLTCRFYFPGIGASNTLRGVVPICRCK